jgi:hypothetical protein
MGNANQCGLSQEEIASFQKTSLFTAEEIRALWFHFKTINASQEFINRKYENLMKTKQ